MRSNFAFLNNNWVELGTLGAQAETQIAIHPNISVEKIGILAEKITEKIIAEEKLLSHLERSQFDRIRYLEEKEILPEHIVDLLHGIRLSYNHVEHEQFKPTQEEGEKILLDGFKLSVWFMKKYSGVPFTPSPFVFPEGCVTKLKEYTNSDEKKEEQLREKGSVETLSAENQGNSPMKLLFAGVVILLVIFVTIQLL